MKQPNANRSDEPVFRALSSPNDRDAISLAEDFQTVAAPDSDDLLTVEDARVALDAIQRLNSKLETENTSLRDRVELLDQLVVKLLKRNRPANK